MTKPGIILQARLGSSRFPNKMLCPINGIPTLQRTIEACLKSGLELVVAIPDKRTEWGLAEWLKLYNPNIKVLTGASEDVALRYKQVNEVVKFDPIIRVCGDNPLMDEWEIEDALYMYNKHHKYQRVNHVEVFSQKELEFVCDNDPFIKRREDCVKLLDNCVDYPEDVERLEEILDNRDG